MTNDEFLSMLNSEFENLEKEYQSAKQKAEGTSRFNPEYEEYQYQFMIVEEKFNALKKLASLPAYARIQAMSDIEIEEYKKDKVEELDSIIKENQQRIEELHHNWGQAPALKKMNEELEEKQKEIKAMTSEETKKVLSYKIKDSYNLAQEIEKCEKTIDKFTELQASMTHDNVEKSKIYDMAKLWTKYKNICEEQKKAETDIIIIDPRLPDGLKRKIAGEGLHIRKETEKDLIYKYNNNYNFCHLDRLMEIVQKFEEGPFKQQKEFFNSQCTEKKLLNLASKREWPTKANPVEAKVDMEFLQQHADKLEDDDLSNLQSLVEKRNKLSRKIFKNKITKSELQHLNEAVAYERERIYRDIMFWYDHQWYDEGKLSPIHFPDDYYKGILYGSFDLRGINILDINELKKELKSSKEEIVQSEQLIKKLKEKIQEEKARQENLKQKYESEKAEVAQQIRTLAGEKYKETNIHFEPVYGHDSSNSLRDFAEAQGKIYEKEIIDKVQREAKKQADIRENELKGISKKVNPLQAKQVDKQIDEMLDELNIETLDAEVSHDMKK